MRMPVTSRVGKGTRTRNSKMPSPTASGVSSEKSLPRSRDPSTTSPRLTALSVKKQARSPYFCRTHPFLLQASTLKLVWTVLTTSNLASKPPSPSLAALLASTVPTVLGSREASELSPAGDGVSIVFIFLQRTRMFCLPSPPSSTQFKSQNCAWPLSLSTNMHVLVNTLCFGLL